MIDVTIRVAVVARKTTWRWFRAAWIAMEVAGWFALDLPLATATVLTGLLLALATRWGLLRYYWVLISFTLTCFAAIVLVVHMPSVSAAAEVARRADGSQLRELGGELFARPLDLLILVAVLVLNVYKPPGLTRFGWRKQHAARASPVVLRNPPMQADASLSGRSW